MTFVSVAIAFATPILLFDVIVLVLEFVFQNMKRRMEPNADFSRNSTFRAGILQLLTTKLEMPGSPRAGSFSRTNGIGSGLAITAVSRIGGDAGEVFDSVDLNKNGLLEVDELRILLDKFAIVPGGAGLSDAQLIGVMNEINDEESGKFAGDSIHYVTKDAFTVWYSKSEARIRSVTKVHIACYCWSTTTCSLFLFFCCLYRRVSLIPVLISTRI